MKYKLINKQTKEETLCDKVTIEGFEYYVSDEKEQVLLGRLYYEYDNHIPIYSFTEETLPKQYYLPQVIATNNPNIDVPKVVDEVEMMALLQYPYPLDVKDKNDKIIQTKGEKPFNHAKIEKYRRAFVIGYNKSQETHPFSEEDMIEFVKWVDNMGYTQVENGLYKSLNDEKGKSTKELLQLWKEQQPKIVYYE